MSDERPDSAMATGSDAGTPGEHRAEPELSGDERALLEELRRPGPHVVGQAVEETPAAAAAADDDAPLPPPDGA